jgi:hypothetical protein
VGRCPPWISGSLLADTMTKAVLQHVAALAQFVGNALR